MATHYALYAAPLLFATRATISPQLRRMVTAAVIGNGLLTAGIYGKRLLLGPSKEFEKRLAGESDADFEDRDTRWRSNWCSDRMSWSFVTANLMPLAMAYYIHRHKQIGVLPVTALASLATVSYAACGLRGFYYLK